MLNFMYPINARKFMKQESIVTKLLSASEILNIQKSKSFVSEPAQYDLSKFLEKVKKEPSPYGEQYLFIK